MKFWAFLLFFFVSSSTLIASHQVGGYLRYDCIGPSTGNLIQYRVSLEFYRDTVGANNGAVFAPTVPLTIINQFGSVSSTSTLSLISTSFATNRLDDPCFVSVDSLAVEQALYQTTISLPRDQSFLLVYQRCCKDRNITNLRSPSNSFGNTFTIELPAFDLVGCNSSPLFNETPPVTYCPFQPISLDLSAIDTDGDVLTYSLCAPLDFNISFNNVEPDPAFLPPYVPIVYQAPFSAQNPIPSNPQLSIDPSTGIVSGNITALGKYSLGFCIEERKNGIVISTTRRDVIFASADCTPAIATAVQDQTLLCDGLSVNFQNNSSSLDPLYTIKGYKWEFGDPTTLGDTSRAFDTTYIYPDTGLYIVTLIANPGLRCSDTMIDSIRVYKLLDPDISTAGSFCADNNSIDFFPSGQFEDYAEFKWEFSNAASINSSPLDTVKNVSFSGTGQFPIRLISEQDICTDTFDTNIEIFPNPIANFSFIPTSDCPPLRASFQDLSLNVTSAEYKWYFGDGDSSELRNPGHTYNNVGIYDLEFVLETTSGCIDTISTIVPDAIEVTLANSINDINFSFTPTSACQPIEISISDSSTYEGNADYYWDFGDGTFSTERNPTHTYNDTGLYQLSLLLITKDTCTDTLAEIHPERLRVNLKPEAVLAVSKNSLPVKDAIVTFDSRASRFDSVSYFFVNGVEVGRADFLEYQFIDTGTYLVSTVIENEFNCRDTANQLVNVFDVFEFIIPNIFTPNGDGINETFKVQACGVYDYEIEIFNRYGQSVFESNSLNMNWDGRVNGLTANSGVYYYLIRIRDFQDQIRKFQGSLTLLK